MNDAALRGLSRAFCDALALREPQRLAPFLDDDVDWMVFGPIDLFPCLGRKRGKAAVLAMCEELGRDFELGPCEAEQTLAVGEQCAAMVRFNAVHRASGRQLSLRLAQFAQFRGDKLVSLRAIFDSFDAAEQALGRTLDVSKAAWAG